MENSFQTSFIPKKPIVDNGAGDSSNKKTTSITMVVSFAILMIVSVSSLGLYLYKDYLLKNKDQLSANLTKIKESFDQGTIVELESYDKRVTTAKSILEGHLVLSPLFELINELTLSSIQYTKFDHKTGDGVFSVSMSGIAKDYKSIALQADVFNEKGKMFKNLIFSNLTKNKNNYVTFDVEFNVDPALLSYSNNINNISSEKISSPTEDIKTENPTEVKTPNPVLDESSSTMTSLPVSNNTQ